MGDMLSLAAARAGVLAEADPGEPIEVCLNEALGLVLAEPLTGDVDLPPFDRAGLYGFAVRAEDALEGVRLDVVGTRRGRRADGPRTADLRLEPGESARVVPGDPMPVGANTVVLADDCRAEPTSGFPREVLILKTPRRGQGVSARGDLLPAGADLAPGSGEEDSE